MTPLPGAEQKETPSSDKATDSELLTRNSIVLLGRYLGVWGIGMLLVLFLPRYLGSEGLGHLQFAQSFVSLFQVGIALGTGHYLVKEVARDRARFGRFVGSALGLRLVSGCLVLGIVAIATEIAGHSSTARQVVYLLALWMVITSLAQLMSSFLHGYEIMGKASLGELLARVFVAAVGITILAQGAGVVAYSVVLVCSAVIQFLVTAWFVSRLAPIGIDFNLERMRTLLKGGMPFLLLGLFQDVYKHIDVVMLRFMTDPDVVGWHAAAFRIFGSFAFLPAVLTAALLPTLSRMYKAGAPHASSIASRSIGTVLLVMAPIGLGMALTAPELIDFMPYPDTFSNTVPILTLLSLTIPITSVLIVFGSIVAAVDRQVAWAYGLMATLALNVTVNAFAIPYSQHLYGNGGIGASVATLFSESIMMLIGIWLVPKKLFTRELASMAGKVAACSALMTATVFVGKAFDLGVFPLAGMGAAVYLASVWALRAVTKQDLAFLQAVILKRKVPQP